MNSFLVAPAPPQNRGTQPTKPQGKEDCNMIQAFFNTAVKVIFDIILMAVIVYGVVAACLGSQVYDIIRYMGG